MRILSLTLLSFLSYLIALSAAEKPNIIFFLVDDYEKPETSPYGGNVLTPNLDRLAAEGMLFNNAYVTSTVCTPSRYTMLTGRYAGSSTAKEFLTFFPKGRQSMPGFNVSLEQDNMNVGNVLARNGYATGFVGKYHVGLEHDEGFFKEAGLFNIPKNIEYTDELNQHKYRNEKIHRKLIKDRGFTWAKNIYWGNLKDPFKGHNPEWTTAAAIEFIEEHKDQPFYLHVCSTLLHGPNGEWHNSLLNRELVTGEGMIEKPIKSQPSRASVMKRIKAAGLTENEAGYLWMDDGIGVILDKLDELGIADNTIFLFVSDHGSSGKGSLFRTKGMEVPCIVRWPNGIKAGTVCDELLQSTDFVPTWLEVAGAEIPKGYHLDGISLAPLFKNPNQPYRDYVFGEMGGARSIKTKDWNLITLRYPKDIIAYEDRKLKQLTGLSGGISRAGYTHKYAFDTDQLYHLGRDPGEQVNLAGDPEHAIQLKKMMRTLSAVLEGFPDHPYGELFPGGDTTGPEEAAALLKRVKIAYGPDAKSKKRLLKRQRKKKKKN
ncbi:MAG: sulfatase-like hydrolase/transferase [Verrucomicrobia bacterium]|jgi:arylsulfatase A-like enzyme|nr:sulfatase-like hydrolase/transferase [Verrucomicrobiota bacterium]